MVVSNRLFFLMNYRFFFEILNLARLNSISQNNMIKNELDLDFIEKVHFTCSPLSNFFIQNVKINGEKVNFLRTYYTKMVSFSVRCDTSQKIFLSNNHKIFAVDGFLPYAQTWLVFTILWKTYNSFEITFLCVETVFIILKKSQSI